MRLMSWQVFADFHSCFNMDLDNNRYGSEFYKNLLSERPILPETA